MDRKVFDRFARQCSRREYSSASVYKKVCAVLAGKSAAGYPMPETPEVQAQAAEVVAALVKEGYVSDERYVRAYVREKSEISGWGPVKIQTHLRAEGLPSDLIKAALEECPLTGQARKKALKVIAVKYNALKDDPQWKLKLLRFALSRGYTYEDASALIAEVIL